VHRRCRDWPGAATSCPRAAAAAPRVMVDGVAAVPEESIVSAATRDDADDANELGFGRSWLSSCLCAESGSPVPFHPTPANKATIPSPRQILNTNPHVFRYISSKTTVTVLHESQITGCVVGASALWGHRIKPNTGVLGTEDRMRWLDGVADGGQGAYGEKEAPLMSRKQVRRRASMLLCSRTGRVCSLDSLSVIPCRQCTL